jgi:hypothetical protein
VLRLIARAKHTPGERTRGGRMVAASVARVLRRLHPREESKMIKDDLHATSMFRPCHVTTVPPLQTTLPRTTSNTASALPDSRSETPPLFPLPLFVPSATFGYLRLPPAVFKLSNVVLRCSKLMLYLAVSYLLCSRALYPKM